MEPVPCIFMTVQTSQMQISQVKSSPYVVLKLDICCGQSEFHLIFKLLKCIRCYNSVLQYTFKDFHIKTSIIDTTDGAAQRQGSEVWNILGATILFKLMQKGQLTQIASLKWVNSQNK